MESPQKHIIIVAGETSGDMHAANLVKEIKALDPSVRFSGLGGTEMQAAGVELYENIVDLAVVGFWEVLKHYGEFRRLFDLVLQKVRETKPRAVILVDYPGFNLRLARALKKLGVKVIYYISPQVWAWKESRVKLIKEATDRMLVLFKFEEDFYRERGLQVDFVGHPLLDMVKVQTSREMFLQSIGFQKDKLTIGLLPGSRTKEVETLLPIMLETARLLYKEDNRIQFVLIKASSLEYSLIQQHTANVGFPLNIVTGQAYDGINACHILMVASGTATLEVAILEKPMAVVYKTSLFTWALAKLFVKIPNIGLVNVVAGKKIVPECIQFDARPEKIAKELKAIYTNELKIAEIKVELGKIKTSLGEHGAAARAAAQVLRII